MRGPRLLGHTDGELRRGDIFSIMGDHRLVPGVLVGWRPTWGGGPALQLWSHGIVISVDPHAMAFTVLWSGRP